MYLAREYLREPKGLLLPTDTMILYSLAHTPTIEANLRIVKRDFINWEPVS
jgi:hypothetical protein